MPGSFPFPAPPGWGKSGRPFTSRDRGLFLASRPGATAAVSRTRSGRLCGSSSAGRHPAASSGSSRAASRERSSSSTSTSLRPSIPSALRDECSSTARNGSRSDALCRWGRTCSRTAAAAANDSAGGATVQVRRGGSQEARPRAASGCRLPGVQHLCSCIRDLIYAWTCVSRLIQAINGPYSGVD